MFLAYTVNVIEPRWVIWPQVASSRRPCPELQTYSNDTYVLQISSAGILYTSKTKAQILRKLWSAAPGWWRHSMSAGPVSRVSTMPSRAINRQSRMRWLTPLCCQHCRGHVHLAKTQGCTTSLFQNFPMSSAPNQTVLVSARIHNFSKNLAATSKFQAPGSSILRTHKQ